MTTEVSIITVNYNGAKLLPRFLDAIESLDFPKDKYETILVDNGSKDGSLELVQSKYPWVKLIKSSYNLGFGAGNNLGVANSEGQLVLLLNNDTIPDKRMLKNIVGCYKRCSAKERIGAINCKMVLVDKYLHLRIKNAVLSKIIKNSYQSINTDFQKMIHEDTKTYYEDVYTPCGTTPGKGKVTLSLSKLRSNNFSVEFGTKIIHGKFLAKGNKEVLVTLSLDGYRFVDLIQNAGNYYFRDGYGRDRGVVSYANRQYYEEDRGQYNKFEKTPGFCGAGVLLNKVAFKKIGGFDEDFFMYYEDGDLSFRLKNNGYSIYYFPDALVRHIHSGSSKEWSDFFIYHVERSRLLFLSKNWPVLIAVREFVKYLIKSTILVPVYYLLRSRDIKVWKRFNLRVRVLKSVFVRFFLNLLDGNRMSYKEYYQLL